MDKKTRQRIIDYVGKEAGEEYLKAVDELSNRPSVDLHALLRAGASFRISDAKTGEPVIHPRHNMVPGKTYTLTPVNPYCKDMSKVPLVLISKDQKGGNNGDNSE